MIGVQIHSDLLVQVVESRIPVHPLGVGANVGLIVGTKVIGVEVGEDLVGVTVGEIVTGPFDGEVVIGVFVGLLVGYAVVGFGTGAADGPSKHPV